MRSVLLSIDNGNTTSLCVFPSNCDLSIKVLLLPINVYGLPKGYRRLCAHIYARSSDAPMDHDDESICMARDEETERKVVQCYIY